MDLLKFEGDKTGISEKQLEFISEVLEDRGFKDEKVDIQVVGKVGDNYASNVKRLIVEKQGTTFSMIAKIAPNVEAQRLAINTNDLFQNEHVMYTHILPKFTELEKAADIPENERLRYAKCYGTFMEVPHEIILLEDLKMSDYIMLDKFVSLTDDAVKLVLKNLAKLHSYSYALKKQEPETYAAFKSQLSNMWALLAKNEQMHLYFQTMEDDILQLVDDKYKIYAKGSLSLMTEFAAEMHKIDIESQYSVIQLGDAIVNNIMFRFKDDMVADCCMIDYQISKESSPVADIQYMIFNCTDYKTRSKHYHDWIDYYHTELDKSLANFGLKANYVYPKEQLDAELKRYGKFSLSTSLSGSTATTRESGDADKLKAAIFEVNTDGEQLEEVMNSAKISALNKETVLKFKTRVEELIDSFVELGYV